jgi:hypothetical protein
MTIDSFILSAFARRFERWAGLVVNDRVWKRPFQYNGRVTEPTPKPQKQPTYFEGIVGSVIPLAVAIAVASVAGFLAYIFWFGTDWIMQRLF